MSRLSDLLAAASRLDARLGADLAAEVADLTRQAHFGLNFERHLPEAVEVPGRPARRGDKVRILPPRGSTTKGDQRMWRVLRIQRTDRGKIAHLRNGDGVDVEEVAVPVDDLVVVAEYVDPIYPGLVPTGKVERGGDKPFHTVINAENLHALELLTFTHRGRVDAIYIDPPYNTGARDWKYNNDYVGTDDEYRHSKWLSFMERRLKLAQELLNPDDSVLIVTIDEKEYLRLGMLLNQVFPEAEIQMISSVINPTGSMRKRSFARTDEYVYFVMNGAASVSPVAVVLPEGRREKVLWQGLRRRGGDGWRRSDRPGLFYPIYRDASGKYAGCGESLALEDSRHGVNHPEGLRVVWPIAPNGEEGRWQVSQERIESQFKEGTARFMSDTPYYLTSGNIEGVSDGSLVPVLDEGGEVSHFEYKVKRELPTTQWAKPHHDARTYGSGLLTNLMPDRKFPFPKSLYAVEDALRFFVKERPNATILDFFSGSGTTAHAVMRLNKQDGGRRQCISVTNNEVSAEEQTRLRKDGLRPGDPEWEALGICDYITKPRIRAAITGLTPDGDPIKGSYKFTDEFPMADGFAENAEFFTLTYETPIGVANNLAYGRVAPLLWLKAGATGRRIDTIPDEGWDVAESYGILFNVDRSADFAGAVNANPAVRAVFVVTDDDFRFQRVCQQLPSQVRPFRLYESYLSNFRILNGAGTNQSGRTADPWTSRRLAA